MGYFAKSYLLKSLVLKKTLAWYTAQKMKLSIKDFFSKYEDSHLLKKSLMKNFIFVQWYDKQSSIKNTFLVKGDKMPFFSFNKLGEKSETTTIFGSFINKP